MKTFGWHKCAGLKPVHQGFSKINEEYMFCVLFKIRSETRIVISFVQIAQTIRAFSANEYIILV